MQVEVTEENIILWNLVQLTGNSTATLMQRAKEAEREGYTLCVRIPDPKDRLESNVFEAADSEVVPDEVLNHASLNRIVEKEESPK